MRFWNQALYGSGSRVLSRFRSETDKSSAPNCLRMREYHRNVAHLEREAEIAVRALGGGDDAVKVLRDTVDSTKERKSDAQIIDAVVRRYERRSKVARIVSEDLRQEAFAAVVKARRSFSPERGEWSGYAYRAAWLAIASYLVAESSPVTRKEKGAPNPARRAPEEALNAYISADNVEGDYSEVEWQRRVRARLSALSDDPDVIRILLQETTPAQVAVERGETVSRLYGLVSEARARAVRDLELYALMQAKKGVEQLPCRR